MADKEQCAFVFIQGGVKRFDGFHVHVIGRLIHQHDVGATQHHFAVEHAAFFATG